MELITRKICSKHFTVAFMLMFLFSFSLPLIKAADAYTLTVINTKVGSGNINGSDNNAGSINCSLGSLEQCSASLSGEVTLTANSDWKSLFDGWGAPCSGIGNCGFTINADTLLTAPFSPNYQAILSGMFTTEYTSLTESYANANDGSTIAAHVYTFTEDLILGRPIFIRLYGGREGIEYLSHLDSYFTTLHGYLEVRLGSVEIDSLIIE